MKSVIELVLYDVLKPFSLKSNMFSVDTEIPTPNMENRSFIEFTHIISEIVPKNKIEPPFLK